MAASKTSTARKPRTLKVRPLDLEARPHEMGGLTLSIKAGDEDGRMYQFELEMGSGSWRRYIAQALGQGAV